MPHLIEQIDHGRFELLQVRIDAFANVLIDQGGEADAVLADVAGLSGWVWVWVR